LAALPIRNRGIFAEGSLHASQQPHRIIWCSAFVILIGNRRQHLTSTIKHNYASTPEDEVKRGKEQEKYKAWYQL
jgi:hypothetical protein